MKNKKKLQTPEKTIRELKKWLAKEEAILAELQKGKSLLDLSEFVLGRSYQLSCLEMVLRKY